MCLTMKCSCTCNQWISLVMSKVPKSTRVLVLPHLSGRSDMKGDGQIDWYTFEVEGLTRTSHKEPPFFTYRRVANNRPPLLRYESWLYFIQQIYCISPKPYVMGVLLTTMSYWAAHQILILVLIRYLNQKQLTYL